MVDMHPPATQRDRWMYEQGRLAERDPRSHPTPPAAPVPLTEPQRKAIYDAVQGMDVMKAILMTEAAHGITAAPEKGQL
jgi:hypothetical protein